MATSTQKYQLLQSVRLTALVQLVALASVGPLWGQRVEIVNSSDGTPIHFEIRGDTTSSVSLVLIHGWSNNRTFWEPHYPRLGADLQLVAVDLAGFGYSGSGRSQWTIEAFSDDVEAVVSSLDTDHIVLAGFSLGGVVALQTALDIPDRLDGVVLIDILQDPTARMSEEDLQNLLVAWKDTWGTTSWAAFRDTPRSLAELYLEKVPARAPEHWWKSLEGVFRWMNTEAVAAVEGVRVPVSAINSDRVPTNVGFYRQHIPSFTLHTIRGASHLGVIWEQTELFDQHLQVLVEAMVEK